MIPSRGSESNQRIHLRYPIKLLVEVSAEGGQSAFVVETHDLSQGGISFYCGWRVPIGQLLKVTFIFAHRSFEMRARVTYCNEEARSWRFYVGAAFLDASGTCYVNLAKQFVRMIERDQNDPEAKSVEIYETSKKADKPVPFWKKIFQR